MHGTEGAKIPKYKLFLHLFRAILFVREILKVYYFSSFAFNYSTTETKLQKLEMISPRNGAPSTGFSYVLSFKERKNFGERQRMVQDILRQQPDKVPLIVERYDKERYLPLLDHCKYLVPSHITIAEVMQIIRRRLQLHPDQAFYLLVNEKSMASITMTIGHLYDFEKDEDGFLYIVYASQPAFG